MAEPLPVAILIEDERQIRRFLRTALETEGWMVHEAETMRQGLTDAGTRRPDLIIPYRSEILTRRVLYRLNKLLCGIVPFVKTDNSHRIEFNGEKMEFNAIDCGK